MKATAFESTREPDSTWNGPEHDMDGQLQGAGEACSDGVARYVVVHLPGLLDLLQRSDVSELEVQQGDIHVRVHRDPELRHAIADDDLAPAANLAPSEPTVTQISAPLVGTFHRAAAPDLPPLVGEGSQVEKETVVGIIEALHVFTEVEAGCSGLVTAVLAGDGQPVQYGEPLFEVTAGG
jgi:acetyl-CoA carboxylase biotin carboxyl carrier protein